MAQRDPWWWPAVGVALGFAIWLSMACVWLALMAVMYGVYLLLGGRALIAFVLIVLAVLLHFQIKDIEDGLDGGPLQNMVVRWLRWRHGRREDG